MVLHKVFFFLF